MKKAISILLVLAMGLLLLVGCSAPAPGKPPQAGTTPPPAGGSTTAPTGGGATPAPSDKVFNITIAHATADTTSIQAGALKWKEVLEATGKFKCEIYPNAQLGGDREAIEGVQNGNITIYASSSAPQVNFVGAAAIFDMPFVYKDVAQARKTLQNEEFHKVISAEFEKGDFHHLGFSDQGFRTLTLNKSVATPDDLKGVSIRTMENKYHMEVWKAIGANPTPLAFNELYTALSQNTVDGQENPVELIHSQKFYEQQKFVIGTNHILQTISWIMDKKVYDSLPDDYKKIIDDKAPEIMKYILEVQDNSLAGYVKEIEAYGTKFVDIAPDNLKLFEERAQSTWDMIKADVPTSVYDAFMKARG